MSAARTSLALLFMALGAGCAGHDHATHEELPGAEGGYLPHSVFQLESAWLDENGDEFRLSQLAPLPTVSAMIYGTCEYACPLIVAKMHQIHAAMDEGPRSKVRFVLFSFDPERDTPSTLAPYKKAKSLDKPGWMMLTSADEEAPLELAVALGVRYKKTPDGEFSHSNIITVLDGDGVPVYQMVGLDPPVDEAVAAVMQAAN